MSVVGNFDSLEDCAGGAPHSLVELPSSCVAARWHRLGDESSSCPPKQRLLNKNHHLHANAWGASRQTWLPTLCLFKWTFPWLIYKWRNYAVLKFLPLCPPNTENRHLPTYLGPLGCQCPFVYNPWRFRSSRLSWATGSQVGTTCTHFHSTAAVHK